MKYPNQKHPLPYKLILKVLQKTKLVCICGLWLAVYGCQNNQTKNNETGDSAINSTDTATTGTDTAEKAPLNIKQAIVTDSISGLPVIEQTIAYADLPITLNENFTEQYQRLRIKIQDVVPSSIKAFISTEVSRYNVRINQIKLPDGSFDGPFSREIKRDIKQNGEVWLIIGKDNMASGTDTGKFEVHILSEKPL